MSVNARGFITVTDANDGELVLVPVSNIRRIDKISATLASAIGSDQTKVSISLKGDENSERNLIRITEDLSTVALLLNRARG
jgi:hypothetical protein